MTLKPRPSLDKRHLLVFVSFSSVGKDTDYLGEGATHKFVLPTWDTGTDNNFLLANKVGHEKKKKTIKAHSRKEVGKKPPSSPHFRVGNAA